jgi:hypothetical protein
LEASPRAELQAHLNRRSVYVSFNDKPSNNA